jgi:hypothetical protein
MVDTVSITFDNSDPRDSNALCDRCGARGTIARATRHSDPPLTLRYCGACWPDVSEELESRQHEEHKQWRPAPLEHPGTAGEPAAPTNWSWSSRSWHNTRRFLELIKGPVKGGPPPSAANFAEIAKEIRDTAQEMDGPMPDDVAEFVARYIPPER